MGVGRRDEGSLWILLFRSACIAVISLSDKEKKVHMLQFQLIRISKLLLSTTIPVPGSIQGFPKVNLQATDI